MDETTPVLGLKPRLLAVLVAAERAELEAVLDRLWEKAPFAVLRPPQPALLLVAARDPFATPFYLGELLVTEAEVGLGEATGAATVCGDEPQGALLAAAAEAVDRSGHPEAKAVLEEFLRRLAPRRRRELQESAHFTAATRVRFDSMAGERIDFGSLGE